MLTKSFQHLFHRNLFHRNLITTLQSSSTRSLKTTSSIYHGYSPSSVNPTTAIDITFVDRQGNEHLVKAPLGFSLLEVAHANNIDLEGACEGSLACSTCHVYLDENTFQQLDEPCDDESDMLDLAFGLSEV